MSDSPVAIVTGGAQGIGAAICKELLKKGYRICIADIQKSKAEEFAREQQKIYGEGNVIVIQCDLTKESDYANVFEGTLKHFKRVDVLVNNAGVLMEPDPRTCVEVNLLGPLLGCHAALKYMGKSKGGNGGAVINTASVAGVVPVPLIPAYAATKHGVVGLTRSFGLPYHYDKDGIFFAALCPYYVDTDMMKSVNRTLEPTLDSSNRPDKMSVEYTAKGVLKLLEDKINGSTLLVVPDGYHYYELDEKLKTLIPAEEEVAGNIKPQ
ncbi:15-hydroxyprostaglandin dehydrogenase [NAD(+)]-like [Argiope bruennichi]|uniref:15-hydroxyprostaglandin dehydrogenase [NAD(+)]-like n=1 Tax=Argiope bruennichi TaxID=94029 RepID=UPI0024954EDB|nr:15-hydroxyprostaglandin dehydrogenase [NAD(+)]-like [Argiope bruennichi]